MNSILASNLSSIENNQMSPSSTFKVSMKGSRDGIKIVSYVKGACNCKRFKKKTNIARLNLIFKKA
mgnify:CR=1 FL=1